MPGLGADGATITRVTYAADSSADMTIAIAGELDVSNIGGIRAQLEAEIGANSRKVVFDLAELHFIDSSGIAMLVQISDRVAEVAIRNAPDLIVRIIELTGLADIFGIYS
jgi:anti-sigma B factor antagonist